MISCYAWTNMQLINLTQICRNFYDGQTADLFIYMLDRIDLKLVQQIENSSLFDNIYKIPAQTFHTDNILDHYIPFYKGVHTIFKRKIFYRNYYKQLLMKKKYDVFLVAGYWGESIYLLTYLYKINKNLVVQLVEEGSGHYSAALGVLCRTQLEKGFRSKIEKMIVAGRHCNKLNTLPTLLFLYEPSARIEPFRLPVYYIPKINPADFSIWMHNIYLETSFTQYQKRYFYFLLTPIVLHYKNDVAQTKKILDTVVTSSSPERVLLKPHPCEFRSVDELKNNYRNDVWIDRDGVMFEAVSSALNINDRVLISRGTSCLMTPKYLFGYEPTIIFTFKLYENRCKLENHDMDVYVKGLKKLYKDSQKIIVVNTLDELKNCILHCYNKLKEV